ncbi:hypothetical protein AB0O07_34860, partial [Streptomyces sp. NPDC093085]|uniref:hypothetical protein n=1 Tax=Streptomyces sp. NPDC093085 TaxID=3155068 RepID=UPI00341D1BB2
PRRRSLPSTPSGAESGPSSLPALSGLRVGMAAYDRRTEMPGLISSFAGSLVCLVRPSGHTWQATLNAVRPATERERIQLRALAELHRRQRPPATPPAPAAPPARRRPA